MSRITIGSAQQLASQIAQEINAKKHLEWSPFAIMTDILEEVGEVASVVKGLEGFKPLEKLKTREMLATELSDLLYRIFMLTEHYQINFEEAFLNTLQDYKRRFL